MAYLVTYRPSPPSSYMDYSTRTRYTTTGIVKETERVEADFLNFEKHPWVRFQNTKDGCSDVWETVKAIAADSVLSIDKV